MAFAAKVGKPKDWNEAAIPNVVKYVTARIAILIIMLRNSTHIHKSNILYINVSIACYQSKQRSILYT